MFSKMLVKTFLDTFSDLFKNNVDRYQLMQKYGRGGVFGSAQGRIIANALTTSKERMLLAAMGLLQDGGVAGDYLEFGVYRGYTITAAYHFAQMFGLSSMRFYGFDSFSGLPALKDIDSGGGFYAGKYTCSLEEYQKNLIMGKVDNAKFQTIPGWFSETLNPKTKKELSIESAAIIYIDCDLYESTVPVLDFITDYVKDGTLIIFDDWYCFRGSPDKGEQLAFREWLKKNPMINASKYIDFPPIGSSFILRKI